MPMWSGAASRFSMRRPPPVSSVKTGGSRASSRNTKARRSRSGPALWCSPAAASSPIRKWAKYLGPGWEMARVRGTRFNMGAGRNMAMAIGARPYGHWSGSHSVAWDINAPPYGDLTVGDQFQKHNYPFGILINAKGERYVDEGANFHSHTYAKYGGE